MLALSPGPLHRDDTGRVVHGEVGAGDGVVWLHRENAAEGLASPLTLGGATACLAVQVDDVVAHHDRVAATGAKIRYPPTPMAYGVLEYAVRDPEGHLWSFQQPLDDEPDPTP